MYVKKKVLKDNPTIFKNGPLHPNFIDGKWRERSRIGKGQKFRRIRKLVLERDSHQCTKCCSDRLLHVHHVVPLRVDVSLAHDIDNLVTLCPKCHVEEENRILGEERGTK